MKPSKANRSLVLIILLMPVQVVVPRDSAETTVRIAAGSGQYLDSVDWTLVGYRPIGVGDCSIAYPTQEPIYDTEPQVTAFKEVSVDIAHKLAASRKTLGIQGHMITSGEAATNYVLSPYFGIEGQHAAVNFGLAFAKKDLPGLEMRAKRVIPTFFLRAGSPGFFATASFLHEIPLTTGGYFQLGIGSGTFPFKKLRWWIGVDGIPFGNPGLSAKIDLRLAPSVDLNSSFRLGSISGTGWRVSEKTASVGLAFRIRHE